MRHRALFPRGECGEGRRDGGGGAQVEADARAPRPVAHFVGGQREQLRQQIGAPAGHPAGAGRRQPPQARAHGGCRGVGLRRRGGTGRETAFGQQPVEAHRQLAVSGLAGVQPVGAPHRPVADPLALAGVQMDRAVPLGQHVDDGVHGPLPPGERAGQGPGQPEHRAGVGQARGEQYGALCRAGRVHPVQAGRDLTDVEGAAQRVVDADDDGDQLGTERQRGGQLAFEHVVGLRPAHREVGEPDRSRAQRRREQRGPAPPAAVDPVPDPLGQ
jgi:hypothetical protein